MIELHYLVIVNNVRRYVILERTRVRAMHKAVINFELMCPTREVRDIRILEVTDTAVLGYREFLLL